MLGNGLGSAESEFLGGGFFHILFSSLKFGKMNQFWRSYFSIGVVQPPTRFSSYLQPIWVPFSTLGAHRFHLLNAPFFVVKSRRDKRHWRRSWIWSCQDPRRVHGELRLRGFEPGHVVRRETAVFCWRPPLGFTQLVVGTGKWPRANDLVTTRLVDNSCEWQVENGSCGTKNVGPRGQDDTCVGRPSPDVGRPCCFLGWSLPKLGPMPW